MKRAFLTGLVLLLSTLHANAGETIRAGDLRRKSLQELDALFAIGCTPGLPLGQAHGTILLRVDGRHVKMCTDGMVWKGKYFRCDGTFINQWVGFRAIKSTAVIGPSWADGLPCVVLDYPQGTPVFGNARDELREIAPGVWLARFYKKLPTPELEGYFVLEIGCPDAVSPPKKRH